MSYIEAYVPNVEHNTVLWQFRNCAIVVVRDAGGKFVAEIVNNVKDYRAERAWGARDIAQIEGASVRLHWTDQPYRWHVNDGAEVFLVLDGSVVMHYRQSGKEQQVELNPGDMFVADVGDEHLASPKGEARILVIEKIGSE
jgi:mannose-6-phosphate isomerase-like protein (cupin superfamily)